MSTYIIMVNCMLKDQWIKNKQISNFGDRFKFCVNVKN